MWTATTIGFFSVVRDRQVKGGVLIRARAKADIWNLYRQFSTAYKGKGRRFKMSRPKADEKRDYRWRIAMRKRDWARIVYRLAMGIGYCNFKDEVHRHRDQDNKSSAYLSIWSAMLRVQHGEDPKRTQTAQQPYFNNFAVNWGDGQDEPIPFEEQPDVMLENMKQAKRIHECNEDEYRELEEKFFQGVKDGQNSKR
jgi:hypothetical protein